MDTGAVTTVSSVLPATAWDQAVFVCIIVVFVVFVFIWKSREDKIARDHAEKLNDKTTEFMQKINKDNSETNEKRDKEYRAWMEDQNRRECTSLDKVTQALEKLSDKIDKHDKNVDDRFRDAVDRVVGK